VSLAYRSSVAPRRPLLGALLAAVLAALLAPSVAVALSPHAPVLAPGAVPRPLGSLPPTERTQWVPGATPAAAVGTFGMVYDAREGFYLSMNTSGLSGNETMSWAYNGSKWTLLNVDPEPNSYGPWRIKQAELSYDTTDRFALVVLLASNGPWAWSFSNYTWSREPAPAGASAFEALSFDPLDHRFVLLDTGATLVWTVGSSSWTNITNASAQPPPSVAPGLCFDGADNVTLFFGGSDPVTGRGTNATWSLSGSVWTNLTDPGRPYPPSFIVGVLSAGPYDTAMAYDPVDGYVVLLHEAPRYIPTMTWTYAHGTWTNVTWRMPAEPPFGPGFLVLSTAAGANLTFWSATQGFWGFDHFGPLAVPGFAPAPAAIDLGQGTTYYATVTGGLPPFTYNYSAPPPGCSTGFPGPSFYCQPTRTGTFPLSLNVSDAIGETSGSATALVVNPPLVLTALRSSGAAVDTGTNWTLAVNATEGTTPYHYAYSGLPGGCTGADRPVLVCAPTQGGPFTVNVTVTDSANARASRSIALTVLPRVGISSFSVSEANVTYGGNVTFTVAPYGGSGSYSIRYTELPPGCTSANTTSLVCAPTEVGSYTVVCLVTDSLGQSAAANTTVRVAPVPVHPTATALPWSYLAIALAAVALVGAALVLARRRSPPAPAEVPEGPPEEEEPGLPAPDDPTNGP
jgi:hypothetical protein